MEQQLHRTRVVVSHWEVSRPNLAMVVKLKLVKVDEAVIAKIVHLHLVLVMLLEKI